MSVDKQRKWSIPDRMECFISEKFPNGTHLVCNVCSVFDMEERKFGVVKMRAPFWLGYFQDHLKSARHKSNCKKKVLHKEANQRRTKSSHPPTKQLKQTVLWFATKTPSERQVSDRICGGVCPSLASGTQKDARILTAGLLDCKHQDSHVCNGILSHIDLPCAVFQEGIKYYQKYFH